MPPRGALPNSLRFPRENTTDYKGTVEFRLVTILPPNIDTFQASRVINTLVDLPGRREIPSSFPNVILYLPQAITFNDGMEYDNNVQLGILGAVGEAALNSGQGVYEAVTSMVNSGLSSFTDLFKQLPTQDLARLAITRAANNIPVVGDVVSSATRVAINPNRRTLFRGVRPREFTFQFKMIASSPREALEIEKIIDFFRREMYPTSIDVGNISAGYKYPNPFRISMKYNGKQVGPEILNSYLTNFTTTYNPSSMGYHVDGYPSEVDIQMNFFEERAIDRADVENGY
jgi:hypothetical protein